MGTKITERKDRPGRRRVQLICPEETRTEQHHKTECDINRILAKGVPSLRPSQMMADGRMYGDFSNAVDYQTALQKVMDAQQDFSLLPPDLRKRFRNNPAELLDFLADPSNRAEAITLGLVDDPDRQVPLPVGTTIPDAPPAAVPPAAAGPPTDGQVTATT